MASTSANSSSLSLKTMLDNVKLNGTNYLDWDRNLRIVLKNERKEYVLNQAIPAEKNIRDQGSIDILMVRKETSFKREAGSGKGKAPAHLARKIRHPKGPNPNKTGESS